MKKSIICLLLTMCSWALHAQSEDAPPIEYFEKSAAAGNVNALKKLVQIFGQGTDQQRKDPARARQWAWRFALSKNAYAAYTFYQLAVDNELRVTDEQGNFDKARYDALAKRPMEDRDLDAKAFSMLSLAAELGYAPAIEEAQQILLSHNGEETADRALAYSLKIQDRYQQKLSAKALAQLAQETHELEKLRSLGMTYASTKLYKEVLPSVIAVADMNESNCDRSRIKVSKLEVTQRIRSEEYLPISAHLLNDTVLITGRWKERWTLDVCGKKVAVPVFFEADGLASARFVVDVSGLALAIK